MPEHLPVLTAEVLSVLHPERGGIFVDATLGLGGHAQALLEANKEITLIGLDQDKEALELAKKRLGNKLEYIHANFSQLDELPALCEMKAADGILMDLGVSSYQIDTPERGFSFQAEGPLDMRMDIREPQTAADIINEWPEPKLVDLFFVYGEERLSRRIARHIVEARKKTPFTTTAELASLIKEAYPSWQRHQHPHPATRVFQALRLEVNQELSMLQEGLHKALSLLAEEGVLAVISFHSLEDRLVKQAFKQAEEGGGYKLLTKKPIIASESERTTNPRSRSAKLRAIQKGNFSLG